MFRFFFSCLRLLLYLHDLLFHAVVSCFPSAPCNAFPLYRFCLQSARSPVPMHPRLPTTWRLPLTTRFPPERSAVLLRLHIHSDTVCPIVAVSDIAITQPTNLYLQYLPALSSAWSAGYRSYGAAFSLYRSYGAAPSDGYRLPWRSASHCRQAKTFRR